MTNIQCFFRWKGAAAVLAALTFFLLVSCEHGAPLKDHDISALYGYTFYGNITAKSGKTLKPSFILYNDNRAAWNMSVNGMNNTHFYYYAVRNRASNYTLYWFGASNENAAKAKDKSKAAMTVQLGIDSLNQLTILLTNDRFTDIKEMANHRVPMQKQTSIRRKTTPPPIDFDSSIQDVTIDIPTAAQPVDWDGLASYDGTFDYLVGEEGELKRGHGTCGKDTEGKEITPKIGIEKGAAGSHKVTVKMHRFISQPGMGIEPFDIPGVNVVKDGSAYYLKYGPSSVEAIKETGEDITLHNVTVHGKLENGKLTLRVSFRPGNMQIPITEIFKSK